MISYHRQQKGVVTSPYGFVPFNYKNVRELWSIVSQYTWSPTIFKDNYRAGKNFLFVDVIGFDFDDCGYTIEQAKSDFQGFKMVIGTTKSHMREKNGKPPGERFRVILPLAQRVADPLDYVATLRSYAKAIDHQADESCFERARQFFPCAALAHAQDGELLPVMPASRDEKWAVEQKAAIDAYKAKHGLLPRHVIEFLDQGKVFGGSRNKSLFVAGQYLKAKGSGPEDLRAAFTDAPFERTDFPDREIENVINSLFKKQNS
jgi:hypothetical protein